MSASCDTAAPLNDICPDQDQVRTQLIATLPRGRAWGTHEGGPLPGSVLYGFMDALAAARVFIEEQICALLPEFFCATADVLRDVWMEDFGLPDGCEPYPDLCVKVAAQGGQRCTDIEAVCAANGWAVSCLPTECCGDRVGMRAGGGKAGGGKYRGTIILLVDLDNSASFSGGVHVPPIASLLRAGMKLNCGPDLSALECLLGRVAPGHAQIVLVASNSPYGALDWTVAGNPLFHLL